MQSRCITIPLCVSAFRKGYFFTVLIGYIHYEAPEDEQKKLHIEFLWNWLRDLMSMKKIEMIKRDVYENVWALLKLITASELG